MLCTAAGCATTAAPRVDAATRGRYASWRAQGTVMQTKTSARAKLAGTPLIGFDIGLRRAPDAMVGARPIEARWPRTMVGISVVEVRAPHAMVGNAVVEVRGPRAMVGQSVVEVRAPRAMVGKVVAEIKAAG